MLYERRFEAGRQDSKYGTEGFILGKKVKALALYDKNKVDEIYGWSKRVLELEKENTEAQVMYLHMIYTAFLRKANKKDCGDVIDAYNLINDLIESGLENITEADSIKWNNFQLAQNKVSDLAGPCLTCENLMEVFFMDPENLGGLGPEVLRQKTRICKQRKFDRHYGKKCRILSKCNRIPSLR